MKVTINNETREVFRISELTFKDFNRIILKNEVTDLPSYLALFFDLPKEQVMDAKFSGSAAILYASIFDCDIVGEVKTHRETVDVLGKTYSTKDLQIDTFGKSYFFELKRQGNSNQHELAMYALALALSNSKLDADVIYDDLCAQNWRNVLPQAFFLHRVMVKNNVLSRASLISSIWALRKIAFQTLYYRTKYRGLEKRSSQRIYVKDLV